MTKILGTLPDGDNNGLHVISRALVEHKDDMHVALVVLRTKRITEDVDTGTFEATARIQRIEVVLPIDLATAEQLMRRAAERRNGGTTLPIEMEDEIAAMFEQVAREWPGLDMETGEVPMPDPAEQEQEEPEAAAEPEQAAEEPERFPFVLTAIQWTDAGRAAEIENTGADPGEFTYRLHQPTCDRLGTAAASGRLYVVQDSDGQWGVTSDMVLAAKDCTRCKPKTAALRKIAEAVRWLSSLDDDATP